MGIMETIATNTRLQVTGYVASRDIDTVQEFSDQYEAHGESYATPISGDYTTVDRHEDPEFWGSDALYKRVEVSK